MSGDNPIKKITYRLALDHTRDSGARQVEEGFDVHVVRGQDQFEQEDLFEVDKVCVPLLDDVGHVLTLEWLLDLRHGFLQVMFTELDDLLEDFRLDVGEGNFRHLLFLVVVIIIVLVLLMVFHHRLDKFRHGCDGHRNDVLFSLLRDLFEVFFETWRGVGEKIRNWVGKENVATTKKKNVSGFIFRSLQKKL